VLKSKVLPAITARVSARLGMRGLSFTPEGGPYSGMVTTSCESSLEVEEFASETPVFNDRAVSHSEATFL
jgi:hypothetical protein